MSQKDYSFIIKFDGKISISFFSRTLFHIQKAIIPVGYSIADKNSFPINKLSKIEKYCELFFKAIEPGREGE